MVEVAVCESITASSLVSWKGAEASDQQPKSVPSWTQTLQRHWSLQMSQRWPISDCAFMRHLDGECLMDHP